MSMSLLHRDSKAGGHRGSFLLSSEDSLTGTISLVPQIVDAVGIPVVAAGGIADARHRCSFRARCPRCADGNGLSCLRRVRGKPVAPQAILSGRRPNFAYTWVHRTPGTRHPDQLLEEMNRPGVAVLPYPLQQATCRNLAVPAQQAQAEHSSFMGWPKCRACPVSRRNCASQIARPWRIRNSVDVRMVDEVNFNPLTPRSGWAQNSASSSKIARTLLRPRGRRLLIPPPKCTDRPSLTHILWNEWRRELDSITAVTAASRCETYSCAIIPCVCAGYKRIRSQAGVFYGFSNWL